jgi:MoxR-like ATPase
VIGYKEVDESMNIVEARKCIERALAVGAPVYLSGTIGIGKSQMVSGVSDSQRIGFVDCRLSQVDAADVRGYPVVHQGKMCWVAPSFLPTEGKGILFLDEINLAPPLIQAAAYQLILDRRIGDYVLPEGWNVVAAGNRDSDRANVFEMAMPLANRFVHIEVEPDIESWTAWASKNGVNRHIVAFLNWKPSMLHKYDENMKGYAFATPRSWAVCSRMVEGVSDWNDFKTFSAMAVGEGVAHEFVAFAKLSDKLDLKEMLSEPDTCKLPDEISIRYSLVSSLADCIILNNKHLEPGIKLGMRLEPEFCALFLRMLAGNTKCYNALLKSPSINTVVERYGKYIM